MTYTTPFQFPMRNRIRCNSMIASNKQRLRHNNLATIWGAKLKGTNKCSKSL